MEKFRTLDPINKKILHRRLNKFAKRKGPSVGEWVILKNGTITRFTYDWGARIQIISDDTSGDMGSFYLGELANGKGYMSYSGSLDPSIPKSHLKPTSEKRLGTCWFFDSDIFGADRGVEYSALFRVWREFDLSKSKIKAFSSLRTLNNEIDKRDYNDIIGLRAKISKADYQRMLEILPPLNWKNDAAHDYSFYMCEFLTGDLTLRFSAPKGAYYAEVVEYSKEKEPKEPRY